MKSRIIRVFISSTFRDMNAERDYLITKVFPRLQVEAAKRDVIIIPLDLRWGVTEEESKTGKVIEICLQEIENSHPFFIGLIGERYGWCPSKSELLKNEILQERWGEWLEKDFAAGLSVTEIEMQYGVLRSKEPVNAHFYLKKKSEKSNFYKDFIAQLSRGNHDKLERLKQQIRRNGRYPVFEYATPEELGQQVEQTFLKLLEKNFPNQALTKLEKERLTQKAFLHSRTTTYIPTEEYFIALDTFANSYEHNYFVVVGESGMGKSALIANWLLHHKKIENAVIYHSLSNGSMQADYKQILRYLCDEIMDMFHISTSTAVYEQEDNDLTKKLEDLFVRIFDKGSVLIILDGINQLADIDNAKLLNWLPSPTKNIKLLFTTTSDDPTYDILKTKQCQELLLLPLNDDQRTQLIIEYLSRYRKKLLPAQVHKIAHHQICQNTHVLQTLLNELVAFGSHELLDKRIDYFLQVTSNEEFFRRVICRYEEDFGKTFCKQILSLIAFSRQGLSELEILKITQIPPLQWSQFYCAFQTHLSHRNELLWFSHQQMQNAVISYYDADEQIIRQTIISTFKHQETIRAWEELAYQYYKSQQTVLLFNLVEKIDVFVYFYNHDVLSLSKYWQYIISNSSDDPKILLAYIKELDNANIHHAELCKTIGFFISYYLSHTYGTGRKYLEMAINHYETIFKKTQSTDILINIATCYADLGAVLPSRTYEENQKASEYFEKALIVLNGVSIVTYANVFAKIYLLRGIHNRHFGLYKKAECDFEKAMEISTDDWESLGITYCQLAIVNNILGIETNSHERFYSAINYCKKAIQFNTINYGIKNPETALSYEIAAQIYSRLNMPDKAMEHSKNSLDILLMIFEHKDKRIANAYDTLGWIYRDNNDYISAIKYMKTALSGFIYSHGENSIDVCLSYKDIGETYMFLKEWNQAISYLEKASDISLKRLQDHNVYNFADTNHKREEIRAAEILKSLANAYLALGNKELALNTLVKSRKDIFRTEYYLQPIFAEIYLMMSKLYAEQKHFSKALTTAGEAVCIYERHEYRIGSALPQTKSFVDNYTQISEQAVNYYSEIIKEINDSGTSSQEIITYYKEIAMVYIGGHNLSGGQGNEHGDYKKALYFLHLALKTEEEIIGKESLNIADICFKIGKLECRFNEYPKALTYYHRTYNILKKHYGEEHKFIARVKNVIENTQKRIH